MTEDRNAAERMRRYRARRRGEDVPKLKPGPEPRARGLSDAVLAELSEDELHAWYRLTAWLVTTKQGSQLLERFGLQAPVLGVCETTDTPTYAMPALMHAVHEAQHAAWLERAERDGKVRQKSGQAPDLRCFNMP